MRAAHQLMTPFILESISCGVHYADLGELLEDHVADTMPRNKRWTTTSHRSVVGASCPLRLGALSALRCSSARRVATEHDQQPRKRTGRWTLWHQKNKLVERSGPIGWFQLVAPHDLRYRHATRPAA